MSQYNFANIDHHEFEHLCRDLINEEHRNDIKTQHGLDYKHMLHFSNFKAGKDKGVDLYFENEGTVVVGQIKHSQDKFQDLYRALQKKVNGINEVDKVNALNPSKYIFITSVPLSLENKKQLLALFDPYIIRLHDIYGREDINRLIVRFPHVERRHVRLYFSNPIVLERLLNLGTISRSDEFLSELTYQVNHFVQTTNFTKAFDVLSNLHLVILKGLPGVGKTTLAKILSFYFIEKGYTFIEILDIDSEIDRLLNSTEQCVFYYDDFLGSNSLVISDALRNEGRLTSLLRRIAQNKKHVLILTTRTNILNNAEYHSENLKRVFTTVSKYEVDVTSLTDEEKKRLVLKHINKNNLDNLIFNEELLNYVIHHTSFSPRLIEFVADSRNFIPDKEKYKQFVEKSFKYPGEIWSHAYNHQLSFTCKVYLIHLFLFGNSCELAIFEKSYRYRLVHEVKYNNYSLNHLEFKESTTIMDGTFINLRNEAWYDQSEIFIEFINPSFVDFMMRDIVNNLPFVKDSILAADNFTLLTKRFDNSKLELLKLISNDDLRNVAFNKIIYSNIDDSTQLLDYFIFLNQYFKIEEIEDNLSAEIIVLIKSEDFFEEVEAAISFILQFRGSKIIKEFLVSDFSNIINKFLSNTSYMTTFENVLSLFDSFKVPFNDYISVYANKQILVRAFNVAVAESIENYVFIRQDDIRSHEDIEEVYSIVIEEYNNYGDKYEFTKSAITQILDNVNWDNIIEFNKFKFMG